MFLTHLTRNHLTLRTLTLNDLVDWCNELPDTRGKPHTISVVRSLLAFCHRIGYTSYDVGSALRCKRSDAAMTPRILSPMQVHQLIQAASPGRQRAMVCALYITGARISELLGLEWAGVTRTSDGASLELRGKGGRARKVAIPPGLLRQLEAISQAPGPVFRTSTGRPLSDRAARAEVRAMAKRAGISEAVSPHWLRHAHASHALDNGAPATAVQHQLGHASLVTTTRYAHASHGSSSYVSYPAGT